MNATTLKIIAVIAMIIDHIAWAFVSLDSPLAQLMHGIGRLTFPIMAFFISEGFFHTKDFSKYLKRIGLFALISHLPYQYFQYGHSARLSEGIGALLSSSIMFTFFISLIVLWIVHTWNKPKYIKIISVICMLILSMFSDYSFFGPLLVLIFSYRRDNIIIQITNASIFIMAFVIITFSLPINENIFMFATFMPLLILLQYNGKQGNTKNKLIKYSFYLIYPIHLLILAIIKYKV